MGVVLPSNGAAAEDHLILGESASLVCEDVVDLTEVLVNVQGTTLEGPESSNVHMQQSSLCSKCRISDISVKGGAHTHCVVY